MHGIKVSLSTLIKYLIYIYIFIITTNVSTGTMPVKIIRVVLAGALALYLIRLKGFRFNFYFIWATIFLLYNVVMIQFAYDKNVANKYTMTLMYILIINMGICLFMMKYDIIEGMIKVFIISTIAEAIITFGRYGLLVFLNTRRTEEGSANMLGFYAAMAFVMSFIMYTKAKGKKQRYLFAFSGFLCILSALLSASRKAIIFAVVPLVVYWILGSKNPLKTVRNVIVAVVVVGIGYYALMHIPFVYNLLGVRIESMLAGFLGGPADSSTATRLRLIEAGMGWFKEKPLFGHGLANYAAMNWAFRGSIYYAHNNYVELLVDCGLVGTLIYYWIYAQIIGKTVKNKNINNKAKGIIIGIAICFLIGDYGMVSYNFAIFQLILMCLFMVAIGKAPSLSSFHIVKDKTDKSALRKRQRGVLYE